MKDSQLVVDGDRAGDKYIKANNERFSTTVSSRSPCASKYIKANNERFSTPGNADWLEILSISRRIMKDSQHLGTGRGAVHKYIKANNERFSTAITTAQASD